MSDVAKTRELVELSLRAADAEVPSEHVGLVLMALEAHYLLKDFPGTPQEYHERVQRAFTEALRKITEHSE